MTKEELDLIARTTPNWIDQAIRLASMIAHAAGQISESNQLAAKNKALADCHRAEIEKLKAKGVSV